MDDWVSVVQGCQLADHKSSGASGVEHEDFKLIEAGSGGYTIGRRVTSPAVQVIAAACSELAGAASASSRRPAPCTTTRWCARGTAPLRTVAPAGSTR